MPSKPANKTSAKPATTFEGPPPPRASGKQADVQWLEFIEDLKGQPGEWGWRPWDRSSAALSSKSKQLRDRYPGRLETCTRNVEGQRRLYGMWLANASDATLHVVNPQPTISMSGDIRPNDEKPQPAPVTPSSPTSTPGTAPTSTSEPTF